MSEKSSPDIKVDVIDGMELELSASQLPSKENVNQQSEKAQPEKQKTTVSMINFYVISIGYLVFTLTDSALRMVVLFELYKRHYDAFQISLALASYEFLGVITNLVGGIIGDRHGLRSCLLIGLSTQIIGIAILSGLQAEWSREFTIIYIAIAQGLCGVAKDMVKSVGKSVTKLVVEEDAKDKLFKLVAWLTGAKNSVKGFGFFFGAFLQELMEYKYSQIVLLGLNLLIVPFAWRFVDHHLGESKSKKKLTFREIFDKGRNVNILSLARMFLFCSRDLWFEVPLPVFLRGPAEWKYITTGSVLAAWVIFYGAVQSSTPQLILKPINLYPVKNAYCNRDKVAMNVGFYYMANAMGRLTGLLVGGALYQYYDNNLVSCLWASAVSLGICMIISVFLGPIPTS
ncbi:12482_t:CDS:2 [Acaulospora morrowiae]|uniref:12482_t:CDS:1 n=1 Tax=Acaulospora morrowiae TaxID=94023 RepID=A0A9N9GQR6_9GLOM|nr:12482_t:CDS:2 [Acaulospora morrowiae]